MPYFVQAYADDCQLTATAKTAKRAFAEAIEWRVVRRFTGVSITDGSRSFSIAEFAKAMALQEIADTIFKPLPVDPAPSARILPVGLHLP